MLNSVELFAGAGGLALGISHAGFRHRAVIEFDHDACDTIRRNQGRGLRHVRDWPLYEGDVRTYNFDALLEDIDLLSGGVPCQPWSLGGKHRGQHDHRNLFPETVEIVRKLRPKAILLENVKGLTRPCFANYFSYIKLMLSHPEIALKEDETWQDHLARLQEHETGGKYKGLHYKVIPGVLNAADYGVPQRRERVFIVGIRADLGAEFSFPSEPTHTQEALLRDQWITGDYWERHCVPKRGRPEKPPNLTARLREGSLFEKKAWQTVRDALRDVPDPRDGGSNGFFNHQFMDGARMYVGHTGSRLDEPAKTLKAGDHGVPGGENMLAFPDGSVRYLTVREAARLQTFPDEFVFGGCWSETMRQLGNAVPVNLASMVAGRIRECLQPRR